MQKSADSASGYWEVERQSVGQPLRPYCVVILRNKRKAMQSIVKASSTDFESMNEYADQLRKDLLELTNDEFMDKYKLGSAA